MLWRRILKLVFPIACMACLTIGFAGIGRWFVLGVGLALPAWLASFNGDPVFSRRRGLFCPSAWPRPAC